jgi:hypothetical protein
MLGRNYKLVRKEDGLVKEAREIGWVEWNEEGGFKNGHKDPKIGYSLVLNPRSFSYTWLTTTVTEIIEQREDYTHFKTENSEYELFKEEDLTDKDLMS